MKKYIILVSAALAVFASCAKTGESGLNDNNKIFLDAWLKVNHPDARREAEGIYVLSETPGTGHAVGSAEDNPYLYLNLTSTDLEGNVAKTSDIKLAQQIGTYKEHSYIGPSLYLRSDLTLEAGLEMMVSSMKVGGVKTALVPGWLNKTGSRFKNEKGYMDNVSGTDAIYTIEVVDAFSDITKWQIDSIETYIKRNYKQVPDSLKYGYYYIQTQAPTDTASFSNTDKLKINYSGKLLNGMVFDTTVEKIAKDGGIYNANKSYEPASVSFAASYEDITLSVDGTDYSGTIDAFAYCLSHIKTGEKGICIFISDLGYQGQSQGGIPAYSPLQFEIEMIGKTK